MATIGELVIKILGDASDFKKVAEGVGQKATQLGQTATAAGEKLSVGLTLPIVGLGIAAVKSSSDLGESINAVNVVFGDANETILEFGENAATAVGLSNEAFNSLATVTGAFLQNVGFDARGAADETINLTTRAADMASVFNTDVSTALNAIQSGLKGEFNPLEQFGVKINAAAIEAKAFALGLGEVTVSQTDVAQAQLNLSDTLDVWNELMEDGKIGTDEAIQASINHAKAVAALEKAQAGSLGPLTDNAKATAALALIYGQTEKLAGDFANTSEGLANSTKIARAELTNAAANIGDQLIPIALQLVEVVREVVAWFMNLTPQARNIILVVLGIAAVLGPLLLIFGAVASAVGALLPVFGAVAAFLAGPFLVPIVAIIAFIALLAAAWTNNWGGIQEKTAAVVAFISGILSRFWEGLKAIFAVGFQFIQMIFSAWSSAFAGDWTAFGTKMREAWDFAWGMIISILQTAWKTISTIVSNLVNSVIDFFVSTNWGEVGTNIIRGIAKGITSGISIIKKAALNAAKAALAAAKAFLGISSPSKAFGELGLMSAKGFGGGFEKEMGKFQPGMSIAMAGANSATGITGGNMPALSRIAPKATVVIPITFAPMFPRDDEETIARALAPAIRRVLHQVGEDG